MRFWGKGEQVKSISPEAAAGGDVELLPDAKVDVEGGFCTRAAC